MLHLFFADKFEFDFRSNLRWCEVMEQQEDQLNPYIVRSFSHILNVHHIWICRLTGRSVESHSFDILPMNYWEQLARQNYLQTIEFLNHPESPETVDYKSEEGVAMTKDAMDILYHILNHSAHHRAQISRELRLLGIEPPAFNFTAFN